MHIGNLRTALYAYFYARKNGGKFVLRIEDTDRERFVEGAIEKIYRTLKTCGIEEDESPEKGGDYGSYIQSERKPLYLEYAKKLAERGGAYYCFCSKERLESLSDDNGNRKYDKHCLNLPKEEVEARLKANEPYVIRQNVPIKDGEVSYTDMVFGKISVPYEDIEDNILIKSDGMPTYNFANVIDDHLMNITTVIRGMEYLSSTPKYNLVYEGFGWEIPEYMHLPPIMRDAQHKLSKRHGDANFEDFTAKGYLPEAIVNYIALLGWAPGDDREKMTLDELIEAFSASGVSKSGSIFDEPKMRWLNAQYIKELPFEKFCELAKPYYEESVIKGKFDYDLFSRSLQPRIEIFSDIIEKVKFIDDFGAFAQEIYYNKKLKVEVEMVKPILEASIKALTVATDYTNEGLVNTLTGVAEALSLKKGQVMWTLRAAITSLPATPMGVTEAAEILGKTETLRRLNFSLNLLK
jgi:glutamyl-tRNA synthetase